MNHPEQQTIDRPQASERTISLPGNGAVEPSRRDAALGGFPRGPAWVMALSLAMIAGLLLLRDVDHDRAFAQPVSSSGARGVFAFTGELTKGSLGVFMVDVDAGTIWCYEYVAGKRKLRLVAARDWRFDRYLENFETEPPPEVVQEILEEQRQAKMAAPR